MRLWSLHPQYLDPQGLVAVWREALLAQAVLRGETRGYRHHPQLLRFREHPAPLSAIAAYLSAIHSEAVRRHYRFDRSKFRNRRLSATIPVTTGQLKYEWRHLKTKLGVRSPGVRLRLRAGALPECHPLFIVHSGAVESWERL